MTPTQQAQRLTNDGILTRDEVAEWLKVKPRQVERLGVPRLDLGRKTKRYLMRDVLRWLEQRRVNNDAVLQDRPAGVSDASHRRTARRKRWGSSRGRAI
jgi:hypothetical protein